MELRSFLKSALKAGLKIVRQSSRRTVSLKTQQKLQGEVLLSFTTGPFLLSEGEALSTVHITDYECFQIASIFLDLGYNVDVIEFDDTDFEPKKDYSVCLDVCFNMERLAPYLSAHCIKILYPFFAHWLTHNAASYTRYHALQHRKGVTLKPVRLQKPNLAAEHSDYLILRGGEFSTRSYSYRAHNIHSIVPGTITVPPWSHNKDFAAVRKNFLWIGGRDFVHKGLDLVLDSFAQMPDCHLYVCASLNAEKNFENTFYKELYETPNIHPQGWVDITSPHFAAIVNNCVGLVHASCSEIRCGAVLDSLLCGLIPVISYESDVDVSQFGTVLQSSSISAIKDAVMSISTLPQERLRDMSREAWEFGGKHSKAEFARQYRDTIQGILAK